MVTDPTSECSKEDCTRNVKARKLCTRHYKAAMQSGEITRVRERQKDKFCRCDGCLLAAKFKGLCSTHYARWMKHDKDESVLVEPYMRANSNFNPDGSQKACSVEGCEGSSTSHTLCKTHESMKRRGVVDMYIPGVQKECPIPQCTRKMGRRARLCSNHNRTRWMYSLDYSTFFGMHEPDNYVCGNDACDSREDLHIDHDHECCAYDTQTTKYSCGKCIRGWLCAGCNKAIGMVHESADRLEGLAQYVRRYEKTPDESGASTLGNRG